MAQYYVQYRIMRFVEANPPPNTYTSIDGNQIFQSCAHTAFIEPPHTSGQIGFAIAELQGLVRADTADIAASERGFTSGPVGTNYFASNSIEISDPLEIPEQYRLPPGDKIPDVIDISNGRAIFDLSDLDVTADFDVNLYAGYKALVQAALPTGIASAFLKAADFYRTTSTFFSANTELLIDAIADAENFDHAAYSARADQIAIAMQNAHTAALARAVGANTALDVMRTANTVIQFAEGGNDLVLTLGKRIDLSGGAGIVSVSIEADVVIGSEASDIIFNRDDPRDPVGVGQRDKFKLKGGDDDLFGSLGAENVAAGDGHDRISGKGGDDFIRGNNGRDWLSGGLGADRLDGGRGSDALFGGAQGDDLRGRSGRDVLYGDDGDDVVDGGVDDDLLYGNQGSDRLLGGDGADVIFGDGVQALGLDALPPGSANVIDPFPIGTNGIVSELFDPIRGHYSVTNPFNIDPHFTYISPNLTAFVPNYGSLPFVSIDGIVNGASKFYSFTVTQDAPTLAFDIDFGYTVPDAATDVVRQPTDVLLGLRLYASDGAVLTSYTSGGGHFLLSGQLRSDFDPGSVSFQDPYVASSHALWDDRLNQNHIVGEPLSKGVYILEVFERTTFDDSYGASSSLTDPGISFSLHVSLEGGGEGVVTDGHDVIHGGDGDDRIEGGGGNDVIRGDDGNDVMFGGTGSDDLYGGRGADQITGGADEDNIFGGAGNDTIFAGAAADYVNGNSGADEIDAGIGDDTIEGGNGDDVIIAGAGADRIFGGNGDDTIWGGYRVQVGPDDYVYYEDADQDTVYHAPGDDDDVLMDILNDTLNLQAHGFADYDAVLATLRDTADGALFDFGEDGSVLFADVDANTLLQHLEIEWGP